jgi:hypothetical protein
VTSTVRWGINDAIFADGEDLAATNVGINLPTDAFLGNDLLHAHDLTAHVPENATAGDTFLTLYIRRLAATYDTLDEDALLLGIGVRYA